MNTLAHHLSACNLVLHHVGDHNCRSYRNWLELLLPGYQLHPDAIYHHVLPRCTCWILMHLMFFDILDCMLGWSWSCFYYGQKCKMQMYTRTPFMLRNTHTHTHSHKAVSCPSILIVSVHCYANHVTPGRVDKRVDQVWASWETGYIRQGQIQDQPLNTPSSFHEGELQLPICNSV